MSLKDKIEKTMFAEGLDDRLQDIASLIDSPLEDVKSRMKTLSFSDYIKVMTALKSKDASTIENMMGLSEGFGPMTADRLNSIAADIKDYVDDHKENFDAYPMDVEVDDKMYDYDEYWEILDKVYPDAYDNQYANESKVKEGWSRLPDMDRDKYQERDGLEGPIMTKSGKVVYYDNKEGKYLDPDTDIYLSHDEWKALDESVNEHKDHEVAMARKDLSRLAKYSVELNAILMGVSEEEGLQGWAQAKITKAADYISSVKHYMEGNEPVNEEDVTVDNEGNIAGYLDTIDEYVEMLFNSAKGTAKDVSLSKESATTIAHRIQNAVDDIRIRELQIKPSNLRQNYESLEEDGADPKPEVGMNFTRVRWANPPMGELEPDDQNEDEYMPGTIIKVSTDHIVVKFFDDTVQKIHVGGIEYDKEENKFYSEENGTSWDTGENDKQDRLAKLAGIQKESQINEAGIMHYSDAKGTPEYKEGQKAAKNDEPYDSNPHSGAEKLKWSKGHNEWRHANKRKKGKPNYGARGQFE